jgi:hypothetical protein
MTVPVADQSLPNSLDPASSLELAARLRTDILLRKGFLAPPVWTFGVGVYIHIYMCVFILFDLI